MCVYLQPKTAASNVGTLQKTTSLTSAKRRRPPTCHPCLLCLLERLTRARSLLARGLSGAGVMTHMGRPLPQQTCLPCLQYLLVLLTHVQSWRRTAPCAVGGVTIQLSSGPRPALPRPWLCRPATAARAVCRPAAKFTVGGMACMGSRHRLLNCRRQVRLLQGSITHAPWPRRQES
jgi:hypothetical protein